MFVFLDWKMMFRAVAAIGALTIGFGVPAIAAPLEPTTPWNVNYTATSCEAKRRFGDVAIAITPSPLGESIRVMAEMPGRALRARQYPARLFSGDGRAPEAATALLFPLSKKGLRGLYSVLPKASVHRALDKEELDIRVGSATAMGNPLNYTTARVHLALGKTGALVKALDTCLADLQKHWGMVAGKLPEPAVASQVVGTIAGIFTSDDYPEDAIAANQRGKSQFLLMIGLTGEVMDCVITVSSGIASLDAMGCQVIRERAKFRPAKNAAGKPVFATTIQSVNWVLE